MVSRLSRPNVSSRPTVAEVMSTALVTAEPMTSVSAAATWMSVHRVGSVLVLAKGSLTAIFTERDVVRAVSAHVDGAGDAIEDWMTRNPATISRRATVDEALDVMIAGGFRHLPVVEAETPVGLVSMRDLCRTGALLSCAADCARRAG